MRNGICDLVAEIRLAQHVAPNLRTMCSLASGSCSLVHVPANPQHRQFVDGLSLHICLRPCNHICPSGAGEECDVDLFLVMPRVIWLRGLIKPHGQIQVPWSPLFSLANVLTECAAQLIDVCSRASHHSCKGLQELAPTSVS